MPAHVMVFNDAQEILELFEMLLMEEGYQVTVDSYGIEDLPRIEKSKPDLLILDFSVGKSHLGWQLLQKIKMLPATVSIPIIICTTAFKLAQDIEGYLLSKSVLIVRKPFELSELLSAIDKSLPAGKHVTASNTTSESTS